MIGIEFVRDPATMEPFPGEVGFGMRVGKNSVHKQKMLIRYAPHWVAVAPPYTVTEAEIDEMVGRLRRRSSRCWASSRSEGSAVERRPAQRLRGPLDAAGGPSMGHERRRIHPVTPCRRHRRGGTGAAAPDRRHRRGGT